MHNPGINTRSPNIATRPAEKKVNKNVTTSNAEENGKENIVNCTSRPYNVQIRKRKQIKNVSHGAHEILN